MGGEWTTSELADLTINFDGKRKPVKESDRRPGPYPYYGASGVVDHVDGFLFDGDYLLIAEDGENLRTRQTPIAFMAKGRFWVNNHAHIVTGNDKADTRFLMYALQKADISGYLTGAVMPKLTQGNLNRIAISHPCVIEQRAIAHILGTLDDKIELNRRRNQTLEAMARALFKDWFVDFGPVRAKMEGRDGQDGLVSGQRHGRRASGPTEPYLPADLWQLFPDRLDDDGRPEGWELRPVYDFANVVYGAPFASKQFNTVGAGTPLIRIRDLASHEPGVWTEQIHPKGHLIEPGDIVVGMDGEFRLHVWKGQSAWLNQRVCHFEPLPGVPSSFLTEALIEPLAFFERGKVGTTVIHLGKSDIDTFRLLHPGDSLLKAFGHVGEPWLAAIVRNALESRILAQLRDTLLPKLIFGELRITDAENFMERTQCQAASQTRSTS